MSSSISEVIDSERRANLNAWKVLFLKTLPYWTKIFKFLRWHLGKRLDKKAKVNFKISDVIDWQTNNCNTQCEKTKATRQWNLFSHKTKVLHRTYKNKYDPPKNLFSKQNNTAASFIIILFPCPVLQQCERRPIKYGPFSDISAWRDNSVNQDSKPRQAFLYIYMKQK